VRDGWLRGWFRRLGFVVYLALSSVSVLISLLVGGYLIFVRDYGLTAAPAPRV